MTSSRAGSSGSARTSGPSPGCRSRPIRPSGPGSTSSTPPAGGVRRVSPARSPQDCRSRAVRIFSRSRRATRASRSAHRSVRSCRAGRSSDAGGWIGRGNTAPPWTRTRPKTSALSGRCCASMSVTSRGGRTSSPFRTRRTGRTIRASGPVRAGARASSRPPSLGLSSCGVWSTGGPRLGPRSGSGSTTRQR